MDQSAGVSRRSFMTGAAALGALGIMAATGCSSNAASSASSSASGSTAAGGVEKEIIVASFGTTFDNSRHITIGAVEDIIRENFPDWKVQRAFTAQDIIDKLAAGKGIAEDGSYDNNPVTIMNFEDAVADAQDKGVKQLVVLATHVTGGAEYQDVKNSLGEVTSKFDKAVLCPPLLDKDEDYEKVADIMHGVTEEYDDGKTAICLMGHGNGNLGDESDKYYQQLQETFTKKGYKNYYIFTVESEVVSYDNVIKLMKESGVDYKKVVLRDIMVVAGDHANNDMADMNDPESFASQFKAAGYDVTCVLDGMGQISGIQFMYLDHVKATMEENSLK